MNASAGTAGSARFRRFKPAFIATDLLMLTYWAVTGAVALGLLDVPPEALYSDYYNPIVVAWNWSFFPLDLIFSVTGLAAVRLHRTGSLVWADMAVISAVCTSIAGLMAIAYWTILGEFDPSWWIPNCIIMLWPVWFLVGFLHDREAAIA